MKADDIRTWDDAEITARLDELKEEQFKLRFQAAMMELENPTLLRTLRRDIARLNTVLHERTSAQNG
ncbi:MAG: 50S ribosomal protein L29 [Gemmatimonadota bacterium]|nr:50S ribosomal protein L29 [Gemmatimonadota bacterium]MDH5760472.1 50S ribosomal protein L29 [Gemmatimonadota bacterium]